MRILFQVSLRVLLACVGAPVLARAGAPGPTRAAAPTAKVAREDEAARLLVLLVVDQLIPEQLLRLDPWLDGGLARLAREGRFFTRAYFQHSCTETGPGHATAATGLHPRRHGIVGNAFHDRESGRSTYCIEDVTVSALRAGSEAGSRSGRVVSPRAMRAPAVGDLVKAVRPDARVVSISGKDRAAVLMGGAGADWALFWDGQVGGFASTDYYGERLPDWTVELNAAWSVRASGWTWSRSWEGELRGSGTAPDDCAGESGRATLPQVLAAFDESSGARELALLARAVVGTPLIDEFVVDLGLAALEALAMGADENPDVLCLGLTGCDTVGHAYGPHSVEVTDLILRLDDQLARLFTALDERVGAGRWVAALTADHGVLGLPERLRDEGVGAERLEIHVIGELLREVERVLTESYGQDFGAIWDEGIVLHWPALDEAGVDATQVRALVREAASSADWVARAYTFDELDQGQQSEDAWLRLAANAFVPDRCADVVVQARPWTLMGMQEGTSHGSPYDYDRLVPLLFLGPGVAPGRDWSVASVVDLVPTLMSLAGLAVPEGLDGRVLDVR